MMRGEPIEVSHPKFVFAMPVFGLLNLVQQGERLATEPSAPGFAKERDLPALYRSRGVDSAGRRRHHAPTTFG